MTKTDCAFNCVMVRSFAIIIEDQTDIAGDPAVDPACDLAACARHHILEARDNAEEKDFSLTSPPGWFELRKITEVRRWQTQGYVRAEFGV